MIEKENDNEAQAALPTPQLLHSLLSEDTNTQAFYIWLHMQHPVQMEYDSDELTK